MVVIDENFVTEIKKNIIDLVFTLINVIETLFSYLILTCECACDYYD